MGGPPGAVQALTGAAPPHHHLGAGVEQGALALASSERPQSRGWPCPEYSQVHCGGWHPPPHLVRGAYRHTCQVTMALKPNKA